MQVMITHRGMTRTRVLQIGRLQLLAMVLTLVLLLMLASGAIYHFVFLKAARDGWPIVSQIVKLVVRDEIAQRDRFMRENLDAIANRVGEMHAKLVKLEAVGERVSGMAGVKVQEMKPVPRTSDDGRGGPFVPAPQPSLQELQDLLSTLDEATEQHLDLFTLVESRLLDARLRAMMVPNSRPVEGPVGSGFGFRIDPFSSRAALHTGLDFPAEVGTPIQAAAGGLVLSSDWHPAYGHMVEVDHGNGLVTRYAHASKLLVDAGALVKRGQKIAEVGSTGRSTGPHLHFEVLLDGVPQDPVRFLEAGAQGGAEALAASKSARKR
jgi:murein DD-endopeptidase MepM/ murein hydrolase activator NlpD